MKEKVIKLLKAGFTNNSQIANHLGISRQLLAQKIQKQSLTDGEVEAIVILLNRNGLQLS